MHDAENRAALNAHISSYPITNTPVNFLNVMAGIWYWIQMKWENDPEKALAYNYVCAARYK